MKNLLFVVLALLSLSACAKEHKNAPEIKAGNENNRMQDSTSLTNTSGYKRYFDEYGVQGSFMLYDMKNNRYIYYDSARCYNRYSPASTFKIPNSLIGLETGVIADENYVIPWDSIKRREPCDKDLTLTEAVKISCAAYFQELARRVGIEKMRKFVNDFNYGNMDLSDGVDKFWLTGSLKISQAEQIEFLKKFYNGQLPVSKRSMDIVRNIIILDEKPGQIFRGKTGWNQSDKNNNGWLVGWVESNENVYFYAINVESSLDNEKFGESRRAITEKILKDMGILK